MSILTFLTILSNKFHQGITRKNLFQRNLLLYWFSKNGGSGRTRTCDLVLPMQQKKIADPRMSKRTYNTRSAD